MDAPNCLLNKFHGQVSFFEQVSKGKFEDLCIRFTDDFNHFLDDWKPDRSADLMNLCTVSEGSYEICSQTEKAVKEENAKWLLNVKWKMTGIWAALKM